MLNWITHRRFNYVDGTCLFSEGILYATGHYWWLLAVIVVGSIVSASLEMAARNTANYGVTNK